MRFVHIALITLILAFAAAAQQGLSNGSAAPQFTLAGYDGQTYDLSQLRGKVVLVTFWSTRCNICHSELPNMNKLAARYKGQDVVFLGLTMENESKVAAYLKNNTFSFTIVPNSFGALLQFADRDRSGNLAIGFPAYFLIDQNGVVRAKSSGWDKTSEIDSQIGRLLSSGPREMVAAASSQK
jgi:peroxiredoxin